MWLGEVLTAPVTADHFTEVSFHPKCVGKSEPSHSGDPETIINILM